MRTFLASILVLLAGISAAEKAQSGDAAPASADPRPAATAEERASATDARPDAAREAKRRAAEALKRFAWTDLGLGRPERRWVGEPINLSLREADLVEVLRSFAKMVDVNLIIDPKVEGKVTVELHDVPWDQALHVILKSHGLGMEISGNVWSAKPAKGLGRDD